MSQRSYAQQQVIVHSRDSSMDSKTSSSSRSSAEGYYSSPSSRTSMTNGYDRAEGFQYRRVPDNGMSTPTQIHRTMSNYHPTSEDKIITSKTTYTAERTIEVHDHRKARYINDEPRASHATYEDFKQTQRRKSRK
jgi:hypothetical protein